jgi:hypothetical protein
MMFYDHWDSKLPRSKLFRSGRLHRAAGLNQVVSQRNTLLPSGGQLFMFIRHSFVLPFWVEGGGAR